MKTIGNIIVFVFLCFSCCIKAQKKEIEILSKDKAEINKAINLYKTDNTKEILTTFLRTALNNITSEEKSFSINTTLYAIDSLFHLSKDEPSDFIKQTSFDFKLKANEQNSVSSIYFGFTTAIVNNKDLKTKKLDSKDFAALEKNVFIQADIKKSLYALLLKKEEISNQKIDSVKAQINTILQSLHKSSKYEDTCFAQTKISKRLRALFSKVNLSHEESQSKQVEFDDVLEGLEDKEISKVQTDIDGELEALKDYINTKELESLNKKWDDAKEKSDFMALTNDINQINFDGDVFREVTKDEDYKRIVKNYREGKDPLKMLHKEVAETYSRRMLWTVSPAMEYDRENKQGIYNMATKMTVGISNKLQRKPWEIEANATFKVSKDTLNQATNYDNQVGLINFGMNKVLLENKDNEPKMEFKFFTQLEHQFGKTYNSPKSIFSLNSTLRINLFKAVWLPITVKYDPDNGNLFGFFSIAANLSD
ncbi:hypothetical protein [Chryseobacterium sp. Bi04]|uniref:hypothetical protein n=1 Tax=Chryseobacterium sp. Bi04 TaxID=2822345 RepID=UPI001D8D776F|nr:hypothetical protein [Chryseobacterium sp. Bi04]CAH0153329.1 hypothetical protein SRABI04_00838 [Chryseobacterium sp. Bi04]